MGCLGRVILFYFAYSHEAFSLPARCLPAKQKVQKISRIQESESRSTTAQPACLAAPLVHEQLGHLPFALPRFVTFCTLAHIAFLLSSPRGTVLEKVFRGLFGPVAPPALILFAA